MSISIVILVIASLLGFLGLILDAIGAHALQNWFSERTSLEALVASWQTAVRIQLFHALFLLCLVSIQDHIGRNWLIASTICTVLGVFIFCGSIYVKALTANPAIGRLAPMGGILLMTAWLLLGAGALLTRFRGP